MSKFGSGSIFVIVLLCLGISLTEKADGAQRINGINPLLKTQWGQRNRFAEFAPNHERLGCWSTAIAQILYFHGLEPNGQVRYATTTGYNISENPGYYSFNRNLFVNKFTENTSERSINEVAKYVYFTSVIIQKDFGTGKYTLNTDDRARAISRHYNVQTAVYSSKKYSLEQIINIIIRELNSRRPVLMYLKNLSETEFHSTVVDGYKIRNSNFFVHINMGNEGRNDGWYDFYNSIRVWDDNAYRLIMTIRP